MSADEEVLSIGSFTDPLVRNWRVRVWFCSAMDVSLSAFLSFNNCCWENLVLQFLPQEQPVDIVLRTASLVHLRSFIVPLFIPSLFDLGLGIRDFTLSFPICTDPLLKSL